MYTFKLPDRETILERLSPIVSNPQAKRVYELVAEKANTDIDPQGLVTLFIESVNTATKGSAAAVTVLAYGYILRWIDALVVEDKPFATEAKKLALEDSR